jgi:hypothetical protein
MMKNFKKVFVVLFILSASTASFAQKFGVKAGLNLSNVMVKDDDDSYDDENKVKPGFHVGVTGEFPISEKFSFATALLLSTKGFKVKGEEDTGFGIVEYKGSFNLMYLELPLTPKISFDAGSAKIYIAAGPYVAMGLSGKAKVEATFNGSTEKESEDVDWGSDDDQVKRLDLGLTAGAGLEINKIQIGISYGYGLSNMSNEDTNGYRMKNRVLGISLGYVFGKD